MKTFVKENTWLPGISHGWGNGYVVIPKGHKLNGMHYDQIDVDVHGGLTFSELVDEGFIREWSDLSEDDLGGWVVGFDTAHGGDNADNCDEEYVYSETERLKEQLLAL